MFTVFKITKGMLVNVENRSIKEMIYSSVFPQRKKMKQYIFVTF